MNKLQPNREQERSKACDDKRELRPHCAKKQRHKDSSDSWNDALYYVPENHPDLTPNTFAGVPYTTIAEVVPAARSCAHILGVTAWVMSWAR
jgi:hypothetical protein